MIISVEQQIKLFRELFKGSDDAYGKERDNGLGLCVKKKVTDWLLHQHLEGKQRIGIYPLIDRDKCWWACIDLDSQDFNAVKAIIGRSKHHGLPCYPERSKRKGFHIWYFLDQAISASKIRSVWEMILEESEVKAELFPKQEDISESRPHGNYIYLPLFMKSRDEERTIFVNEDNIPYPDQWELLSSIERISEAKLDDIIEINDLKREELPNKEKREKRIYNGELLPCFKRISEGVNEGDRNICDFRFAIFLRKQGKSQDDILVILNDCNLKNNPPSEEKEIEEEVKSAFKRDANGDYAYNSYGCDDPHISQFCSPECPLKKKGEREAGDNKEATAGEGEGVEAGEEIKDPSQFFSIKKGKDGKETWTFIPPLLSKEIMSEYHFIYTAGELWYYKNGVYSPGGEKLVKTLCRDKLDNQSRLHRTAEVLFDIQVASQLDEAELNPDPYILNLENGLLDIHSLKLKPHTPDYYSTTRIPIKYNPNAKCPKIDKFFRDIAPSDCVEILYQFFGYCLLALTPYQIAFMLVGPRGTGKSTFLMLLIIFLGKENTANIPLQDLSDNRFKRADLLGKLANVFADLDSRALQSSSYFKTIVAGDRIDAERKHQDPFYFTPFAKLIFSANEIPRSHDRSDAFYRRWVMIRFSNKFSKELGNLIPKDELLKTLTEPSELSGLLNKALVGLRELEQNKGFDIPQSAQEELEEYIISNDNVMQFVSECCDLDKEATSGRTEVFKRYKDFCEGSNLHPVSQREFNKKLESIEITRDQEGNIRIWRGLHLKN